METKLPIVLSVDDNDVDGALLQRAFKRTAIPARLFTVSEGPQALAYMSGDGIYSNRENYPFPDLILLDLAMPKMHGLDLLKLIRQHPLLKKSIVIIFTSSDRSDDKTMAQHYGADAYLVKPSKFDDLKQMVKKMHTDYLLKPRKARSAGTTAATPLTVEQPSVAGISGEATVARPEMEPATAV